MVEFLQASIPVKRETTSLSKLSQNVNNLLVLQEYHKGEQIVKENKEGEGFLYFIKEGTC